MRNVKMAHYHISNSVLNASCVCVHTYLVLRAVSGKCSLSKTLTQNISYLLREFLHSFLMKGSSQFKRFSCSCTLKFSHVININGDIPTTCNITKGHGDTNQVKDCPSIQFKGI